MIAVGIELHFGVAPLAITRILYTTLFVRIMDKCPKQDGICVRMH